MKTEFKSVMTICTTLFTYLEAVSSEKAKETVAFRKKTPTFGKRIDNLTNEIVGERRCVRGQ